MDKKNPPPYVTKNGSPIRTSDGPVKLCPDCGNWIRVSMAPCGEKKAG